MSGVSGVAPGLVGEARPHIQPVWAVGITSTQRGEDAQDPNQMVLSSASSQGLPVHQTAVEEYQGKYPSSFTLLSNVLTNPTEKNHPALSKQSVDLRIQEFAQALTYQVSNEPRKLPRTPKQSLLPPVCTPGLLPPCGSLVPH